MNKKVRNAKHKQQNIKPPPKKEERFGPDFRVHSTVKSSAYTPTGLRDNPFAEPQNGNEETYAQFKRRLRNLVRYDENRYMKQLQLPFMEDVDSIQLKLF